MMEGLEDDGTEVFKGGTLEITNETLKSKESNQENVQHESTPKTNTKNKIWNGITPIIAIPKKITDTLWSCKEPRNTIDEQRSNNTTTQVVPVLTTESPSDFFTFRDGVVEKAVKECIDVIINPDIDGHVLGTFLMTEISFWDTEKERLVILTSNFIFSIKYDFIALRQIEFRKIPLENVDCVVTGDLVYPAGSLVPRLNGIASGLSDTMKGRLLQRRPPLDDMFQPRNRNTRGVRLMWNKGEPLAFKQKWNPFSSEVPFLTFTSHPLYMHTDSLDERRRLIYGLEEFCHCLIDAVESVLILKGLSPCVVHHKEIMLQTYVGLGSLIHNRNALGFFKVRGKFSF